jgi:hypothetical protein
MKTASICAICAPNFYLNPAGTACPDVTVPQCVSYIPNTNNCIGCDTGFSLATGNTCPTTPSPPPTNCAVASGGNCSTCKFGFQLVSPSLCLSNQNINIQSPVDGGKYLAFETPFQGQATPVMSAAAGTIAGNNYVRVLGISNVYMLSDPSTTQVLTVNSSGKLVWDSINIFGTTKAHWSVSPLGSGFVFKNVGTGQYLASLNSLGSTPISFNVFYL